MNLSIDIIFKVLNFLVTIVLFVYVIKRYVIGKIMLSIAQEETALDVLQQQRADLKQGCDNVEKTMKAERAIFQIIQKKFVVWDTIVKSELLQEQVLCQERQKTMNVQANRKLETMQRNKLLKTEIAEIISKTGDDLQQAFQADTALGQKYINKVLDALAE